MIGYNNIAEAAVANLTTVDSSGTEKGRVAARIVFADGTVRHETLPTQLVVRGTTAPPPSRQPPTKQGGSHEHCN